MTDGLRVGNGPLTQGQLLGIVFVSTLGGGGGGGGGPRLKNYRSNSENGDLSLRVIPLCVKPGAGLENSCTCLFRPLPGILPL